MAFIGVMFITPDSLFIRLSNIETWGMLFYRGAIPFLVVLFGLIIFYKKNFFNALFFSKLNFWILTPEIEPFPIKVVFLNANSLAINWACDLLSQKTL